MRCGLLGMIEKLAGVPVPVECLNCLLAQGQQQGALGGAQGGFAQQLGGGRVGMPGLHALQQGMAGGGGTDCAPGGGGRAGFGQNPGDPAQNSSMLQGIAAAGGGGGGISQDMMRFAAYQQQMREQAALKARPPSPGACLPCFSRARLGLGSAGSSPQGGLRSSKSGWKDTMPCEAAVRAVHIEPTASAHAGRAVLATGRLLTDLPIGVVQAGAAPGVPPPGKLGGAGAPGGPPLAAQPDRFGLLGLLGVIRMTDPDLTTLALGTDLTTLGLHLNSPENVYKTFASPWADTPLRTEVEFKVAPRAHPARPAGPCTALCGLH